MCVLKLMILYLEITFNLGQAVALALGALVVLGVLQICVGFVLSCHPLRALERFVL